METYGILAKILVVLVEVVASKDSVRIATLPARFRPISAYNDLRSCEIGYVRAHDYFIDEIFNQRLYDDELKTQRSVRGESIFSTLAEIR